MNYSIDERIIRIFKERYKVEPSILYFENEKIDKEKIEKFLNKSYLIYVNKEVIDHKIELLLSNMENLGVIGNLEVPVSDLA